MNGSLQKGLLCISTIAAILMSSNAAKATDWQTVGVSSRTRETVAIDLDSIDRSRGQYDVRFRYLIGKDLVKASVNCDSSLVTPDMGKPFVPDATGATREMIKIACGTNRNSTPTRRERSYDRGYGDGSAANERSFSVPRLAIPRVRAISDYDFGKYYVSDETIADDLRGVCQMYSSGRDTKEIWAMQDSIANRMATDDSGKRVIKDYFASINVIAVRHVCPEYDY